MTINRAIEIAKAALDHAKARNESWADAVDSALSAEGFTTLDAVRYGAETDTRLIAVVEIEAVPHAIHRYDTGEWGCEPVKSSSGF